MANHLLIEEMSDNLTLSLDEDEYDENDRKAIVARIANITITTINSTSVNAWGFLEWTINFKLKLNVPVF
jgi:hypothetical protein